MHVFIVSDILLARKLIMLGFAKVESVGQGFVDEMFRVYPSKNPNVSTFYKNANPEVEFMIKRGLPKI